MLRKFIARLRESIAPAKKPKPTAPQAASTPAGGPAPRRPAQAAGEGRPQGQGPRRPRVARRGPFPRGPPQGRPQEGRPRQEERRPAGRGPSRSGPAGHGRRRRPRPPATISSTRATRPGEAAVPVDIPKMDTPSRSSASSTRWPMRSRRWATRSRRRSRSRRSRSSWRASDVIGSAQTGHGQDRRVRAADHPAPRPPRAPCAA
jgi:hypothetical protein